jgi:hydroxyquinol 1,2-dioxygenase
LEVTTMSDAPDELLAEVLGRYEGSTNPRLKEVMQAAISHMHAFVREVEPSRDEWMAAIQWLTATGQMCTDTRQEFILFSDRGVDAGRDDELLRVRRDD